MGKHGAPVAWRGRWWHRMPRGHYRHAKGKLLHRAMYEVHFGQIPPSHDIHHKDENPGNNVPSNFEALTRSQHVAKHRRVGFNILFDKPKFGTCVVCGDRTTTYTRLPAIHCSNRCAQRAYRQRNRIEPIKRQFECLHCGKRVESIWANKVYCNRGCKARHWIERFGGRKSARLQSECG